MSLETIAEYTAETDYDNVEGLLYFGGFLYVVPNYVDSQPFVVIKVNPATMEEVDRFSDDDLAAYGGPNRLATDGTYIYVGCWDPAAPFDGDAVVLKINPSDMSEVARWATMFEALDGPESLYYLAPYIYVAIPHYTAPGNEVVLLKLDPSDMSEVDRATFGTGAQAPDITSDGTHLYLSYDDNFVGQLLKIDPSDMSEVDSFSSGNEGYYGIAFDGTYVCGFYYPQTFYQVDPTDMTLHNSRALSGVQSIDSLHFNGSYLYYGGRASSLALLLKIDPSDLSTIDSWVGATSDYVKRITTDDTYIYAGLSSEPAIVDKIGAGGKAKSFVVITSS